MLEEVFRNDAYRLPAGATEHLADCSAPRIVDLGGHVGYFGLFVRSIFPDSDLTSFEPDPDNAAALSECIAANEGPGSWRLINAAAGANDGEMEFLSDFQLSRAADCGEGLEAEIRVLERIFPFLASSDLHQPRRVVVQKRDIFRYLDDVDLLKIDIEGGEWELLSDPRMRSVGARVLVLEYHPAGCPGDDPRALMNEALAGAGYELGPHEHVHDGAGIQWAWRSDPATIEWE